jgi:hypothetical protein
MNTYDLSQVQVRFGGHELTWRSWDWSAKRKRNRPKRRPLAERLERRRKNWERVKARR